MELSDGESVQPESTRTSEIIQFLKGIDVDSMSAQERREVYKVVLRLRRRLLVEAPLDEESWNREVALLKAAFDALTAEVDRLDSNTKLRRSENEAYEIARIIHGKIHALRNGLYDNTRSWESLPAAYCVLTGEEPTIADYPRVNPARPTSVLAQIRQIHTWLQQLLTSFGAR